MEEHIKFLGNASGFLENWNEAIDYISQAITLKPNDENLYFSRGWYFSQINKYSEALADYFKSLEINKNSNPKTYLNISELYTNHFEMYDEALKFENIGIDLFPRKR